MEATKTTSHDNYKVDRINEHLKAMKEDSYYLAQLSGAATKNINLDIEALQMLRQYYEGDKKLYGLVLTLEGTDAIRDTDVLYVSFDKDTLRVKMKGYVEDYKNFIDERGIKDEDEDGLETNFENGFFKIEIKGIYLI